MPTLVKLTTAGESVTMKVASCEKNTVGNYPGFLFTGKDTRGNIITVEIPESSTKRQLDRLELTPASVVGRVVTISRDPNANSPAKPYWGLTLADAGDEPVVQEETGAPPKPQPAKAPPATPAVGPEAVIAAYLGLLDRVADHIQQETRAGFKDYATAQPIAATCWITLKDKGLV